MPARDIRDRLTLTPEVLEDLVVRLDNRALAAAVRLISAQIRGSGQGVPTHVHLTTAAGTGSKNLRALEAQLREVFDTSEGYWNHPDISRMAALEQEKRQARRTRQHAGSPSPPPATAAHGNDGVEETLMPTPRVDEQAPDARVPEPSTATASTPPQPAMPGPLGMAARRHARAATAAKSSNPTAPQLAQDRVTPATPDGPAHPGPTAGAPGGQVELFAPGPSDSGSPSPNSPTHTASQAPAGATDPNLPAVGAGPSLVAMVYDRGVQLLMQHGQTASRARSCLAMLLKDHDTAYVIKVIDAVEQRRGRVAEPFSYMRQLLKNYPRRQDEQNITSGAVNGRSDRSHAGGVSTRPRPIATPETMGLSDGLARRIQEKARSRTGYVFDDPAPAHNKQN